MEPWPTRGREHPSRDASMQGAKRPLGPGSPTSKVDFTPARKCLQVFVGPSLDLRARFQTRQKCCQDFCGPVPLQQWVRFGPRMPAQGLQNTPNTNLGGSVYMET